MKSEDAYQVLYISYDGMTDPLGQSQVIPYISGLSQQGYSFTLISCEKKHNYQKFGAEISDLLRSANIDWHPLFYTKKPPVLSTVWDISRIYRTARKLHALKKFKLVHCRSYIASLIGLRLKRKYGIKFIFDMRGFWADERVEGGLWNLKNPFYRSVYRYFKNKERQFLAECDANVSLTEAGKREMENWEVWKQHHTDITVIPCSADFNFFKDPGIAVKQAQRNILGIPADAFVLSYLGSLGTWYMAEQMLDFFGVLLTVKPHSVFLILTADSSDEIRRKAKEKNIPDEKIIVLFSPRKDIVKNTSVSDLSIFFIKPSYSKLASSPTKLGELLAMNIPVISNAKVGDVDQILESTKGGVVIKDFNEAEYRNAIHRVEAISTEVLNLRERAFNYYDLKNAVEKYSGIYRRLLR